MAPCPKVGLMEIVVMDLVVQRCGADQRIALLLVVGMVGSGGSMRDVTVRTSAKLWLPATTPSRWHHV